MWSLQPSEVFKAIACAHPRFYIGTRAAEETRHALFDIDAKSQYHNKHSLDKIIAMLKSAGIESFNLYRSSQSEGLEGWHLYIYFDEFVPTKVLRAALVQLCLANGLKIKSGTLEIFPNPGTPGSEGFGIRLPLQPGFAWLSHETLKVIEERVDLNPDEALHRLLSDVVDGNDYNCFRQLVDYADRLYRDHQKIQDALKAAFPNVVPLRVNPPALEEATADDITAVIEIFGYVPPGMKVARWINGRSFTHTGLTEESQRHQASMDLNHYYFYGDPSRRVPPLGYANEEMRRVLVEADIERGHNGLSKEINRGSLVAWQEIRQMAYWRPAHKKNAGAPLPQSGDRELPPPIVRIRANNKRMRGARARIVDAVAHLMDVGTFLSKDAIAAEAKCSPTTAAKHDDLWRHLQEQQWAVRLAKGTGEFKGVVEGAEPQKAQPSSTTVLKAPAGLLEARQIAYELSMRNAREAKKQKRDVLFSFEAEKQSWKNEVLSHLPESLATADSLCLQFLQARYGVLLSRSPDFESQEWLQNILESIAMEMKGRWIAPDVVSLEDNTKSLVAESLSLLDTG